MQDWGPFVLQKTAEIPSIFEAVWASKNVKLSTQYTWRFFVPSCQNRIIWQPKMDLEFRSDAENESP